MALGDPNLPNITLLRDCIQNGGRLVQVGPRVCDDPSLQNACQSVPLEHSPTGLRLNSALGWHTHPGPAIVTVVSGSLGSQREVQGECVTTWHTAGTGFMDPGFGHVHRAVSRGDGFDAYTTFVIPSGSPSQTIPADPPAACS